jgi:hypothetical protein
MSGPAPAELEQPQRKRPNRLLDHADTAVGPRAPTAEAYAIAAGSLNGSVAP